MLISAVALATVLALGFAVSKAGGTRDSAAEHGRLEEFISGAYTPEAGPALLDSASFHRVYPRENGWAFAWNHADEPELAAISWRQYLPTVHFEDAESLADYAAEGDGIFGFASILGQYDDGFFADNTLVLIYVTDYSGSITHDIGSISVDSDGTMEIGIRRFVPEAFTDDRLDRLIVIACAKEATQSVKRYEAYIEHTPDVQATV
jgi:hypothetical protein